MLRDPRSDLWMIFDYEGVKRALNDHDAFSSGASPSGGQPLDWLIFSDPPRHTKLRAIILRAFILFLQLLGPLSRPQIVAAGANRNTDCVRARVSSWGRA